MSSNRRGKKRDKLKLKQSRQSTLKHYFSGEKNVAEESRTASKIPSPTAESKIPSPTAKSKIPSPTATGSQGPILDLTEDNDPQPHHSPAASMAVPLTTALALVTPPHKVPVTRVNEGRRHRSTVAMATDSQLKGTDYSDVAMSKAVSHRNIVNPFAVMGSRNTQKHHGSKSDHTLEAQANTCSHGNERGIKVLSLKSRKRKHSPSKTGRCPKPSRLKTASLERSCTPSDSQQCSPIKGKMATTSALSTEGKMATTSALSTEGKMATTSALSTEGKMATTSALSTEGKMATYSTEDQEMLLAYATTGDEAQVRPSLAQLEKYESTKVHLTMEGPVDSTHSPTFSPRKRTPLQFTRHPGASLDMSMPLFDTPDDDITSKQNACNHSNKAKKTLFQAEPVVAIATNSKAPTDETRTSYIDDDFSLSDFMDQSLLALESHDQADDATMRSHDQADDVTRRSHDQADDVTMRSHDQADDVTRRSHNQADDVTRRSHDQADDATRRSHDFQRYLVLECVTQERTDQEGLLRTGRHKPEMLLRLMDEKSSTERLCFLRDDWLQTDVVPGDIIQLNAPYYIPESYIIDNNRDCSVVVNPDCLVSGTTVAIGTTCARRAVLSERFKGSSGESEAMTFGRMLHQIFQNVLLRATQGAKVTLALVSEEAQKVVTTLESLEQLYVLAISEREAEEKLSVFVPGMVEWCKRYLHDTPQVGRGEIEFKRGVCDKDGNTCISVSDITDIEENIWSPRFGLKGKVDVTVKVKAQRGGEVESFMAPLELKTGKMFRRQGSLEHRAQVTLYSIMLGGCHGNNVPGGLLYYMKTGHMQGLPALPHDKRGLIIARNHLAGYHGNKSDHMTLPGMLRDTHTCKYCPYLSQCTLYHRAVEHGTMATSGVGDLFSKHTDHLTSSQLDFFAKWYQLIIEEKTHCMMKEGPPIWLTTPEQREKEGRCVSNMMAKEATMNELGRHVQTFHKQEQFSSNSEPHELILSQNNRVVISNQDGSRWAIAMGTVTMVMSPREVKVTVDKPVATGDSLYRLDVMTGGVSSGTPLANLAGMCSSDSERDDRLRELIIDLKAPRFSTINIDEDDLYSGLNPSQRATIHKVLSAKDYTLVLGMPGTGKTTTISHLVQVLVAQGLSVLLTSYTHSAVDNILLKLKEANLDFLRLGSPMRVHPDIVPFTPWHAVGEITTVQQLKELYENKLVVATTCLGTNHPLFSQRSFDYCILDEASQITLPVSLGPLRHARVFVLVGDHYQLPPLVQNEWAREGGYDVSLFRRLSDGHPSALVTLDLQYRMNSAIMSLANVLVYNNRLKCGNDTIATARLHMSQHQSLLRELSSNASSRWVWSAVDPAHPVVFLNTDKCDAPEVHARDGIFNNHEVHLVKTVIHALTKGGVCFSRIGVITPYRHQQNLIKESIRELEDGKLVGVEVNTVDKYQGRDKDCVIVSFVRNNESGNVGKLLLDWRRINVAITRARHKLILIGSQRTLRQSPLLSCLLDLMQENCWITDVPPMITFK